MGVEECRSLATASSRHGRRSSSPEIVAEGMRHGAAAASRQRRNPKVEQLTSLEELVGCSRCFGSP